MSPQQAGAGWRHMAAVALCLCALSAAAVFTVWRHGWILYYGDAEAHLEIARRIIDSRTPGYPQIGTVWLPLPHLLMLPLVIMDRLWQTGLAGSIPSALCFITGGLFLFAAARYIFRSLAAALAVVGVFALNPNLLYLQATPMTEAVLFAAFMALLYFTCLYRETAATAAVVGAGIANCAAALTRYEGWFVIPFVAGFFFITAPRRRLSTALLFSAIAGAGPLFWLLHNFWFFGDPLEFYRGQYSAKAIYARALAAGLHRYPGDGNWRDSLLYFGTACRLASGSVAVVIGLAGTLLAILHRNWWPLLFVMLAPLFYVWSMYSSGTPIFVPTLWPNSYYNTRYGLAALPLFALGTGYVVNIVHTRIRPAMASVLISCCALYWLAVPAPDRWVCWKESQVNSDTRRAWTEAAARYLAAHYIPGTGIFTSLGDNAAIYREAGIPLRQALHDGNEPAWMAAVARPDLFLHEMWVVAAAGDSVDHAMSLDRAHGAHYHPVASIVIKDAAPITIYRRNVDPPPTELNLHDNPIHQSARRRKRLPPDVG